MPVARFSLLVLVALAAACGGGGDSGGGGPPPDFDGVVTVTGGKNRITLTWGAARPAGSVTYHIYRRRAAEQHDFSSSLDRTSSLSYSDTSAVPDVDYFYVVRATRNGVDFDDNVVELSDYAVSVALPEDDGPHSPYDVEWWYYTGHLDNGQGDLWGFEFVFFKLEVGALCASFAFGISGKGQPLSMSNRSHRSLYLFATFPHKGHVKRQPGPAKGRQSLTAF